MVQPWLGERPEITEWSLGNSLLSLSMKATPQQAEEYAAALQLQKEEGTEMPTVRYASPTPCRLRTPDGRFHHENVHIRLESGHTSCTLEIYNACVGEQEPRTIMARFAEEPAWADWLPQACTTFLLAHGSLRAAVDTLIQMMWAVLYLAPCLLVDGALLLNWRCAPHGKERWAKWELLPIPALALSFLPLLATLPNDPLTFLGMVFLFIILSAASTLLSLLLGGAAHLLTTALKRPEAKGALGAEQVENA